MNAFDILLAQWNKQVKEIFPRLHCYQQNALAFSVQGILQSGNAVMQRVAETMWEYLSGSTHMTSHERRLQRFVENDRIDVDACWNDFLQYILSPWQGKSATLVLDLTPYTKEETIVYLGLIVHSRALPIAWCVMPQQEKWDQAQWEIVGRLFDQVSGALAQATCTLLADRGLSCLHLVSLCKKVGWHYVLRIKNEEWFRKKYRHWYQDWQQGKQTVKKEGEQWYGEVLLWQEHQWPTWLSICWEPGYDQAWFLISDRRASHQRVNDYRKRMKVEACFQDQKSRGYGIESSRFTNRDHLNRWLLAVYIALWWAAHLGCSCMHNGQRKLVDRADRRDKGVLRLGRLWLKALLKKGNNDLDTQRKAHISGIIAAQLANCLPFFHRKERLCFCISLH